jgi:hypothetical protein
MVVCVFPFQFDVFHLAAFKPEATDLALSRVVTTTWRDMLFNNITAYPSCLVGYSFSLDRVVIVLLHVLL